MNINELSERVGKKLITKRLTLGICESCTGGMLGSIITAVPGSSRYFQGGVIAYSNLIKEKVVGVRRTVLRKFGAVSVETAEEMARGVRRRLKSKIGVGITGIAGPTGGTKDKPVGLVYIGIAIGGRCSVKKFLFKGNRNTVRKNACKEALIFLNDLLSKRGRR